MPNATVTFSDGGTWTYKDVPAAINTLQVAERARKDFPDKRISGVAGVQSAPLLDKLKAFATTGQEDIATKDLPQLAYGVAQGPAGLLNALGVTGNMPEPKTPEDIANRKAGGELMLGIRPAAPFLAAPAAVRGAAGRMVSNDPRTLANAARIAQTAKTPPSTAAIPAVAQTWKAVVNAPGWAKLAAAAGFGYGTGAVKKLFHFLAAQAE